MWLLAAFIAIPLIEIGLFIQVGGLIGLWPTLAIVLITAIVGSNMVRVQGRSALMDLQRAFSTMRDPSEPLAHGAMILFSGVLLLTPGFFTDAMGLALLVPQIRRFVMGQARKRVKVQSFSAHSTAAPYNHDRPYGSRHPDVIDAEVVDVSNDEH